MIESTYFFFKFKVASTSRLGYQQKVAEEEEVPLLGLDALEHRGKTLLQGDGNKHTKKMYR